MRKGSKTLKWIAIGSLLAGASNLALAQDVDAKLNAYKAASAEAVAAMARITDAASAKANQGALDAALAKQKAAQDALNAETKKLKVTDKKDADKMTAAMAEQQKANESITAQQMRILMNKDAGEVVGKSFMK